MKQVYEVIIAGVPLRIATEEEERYLVSLASSLSDKVSGIVLKNKSASKIDAALLCALDSMDREVKLRALVKQLQADNTRLLGKLEAAGKHGK